MLNSFASGENGSSAIRSAHKPVFLVRSMLWDRTPQGDPRLVSNERCAPIVEVPPDVIQSLHSIMAKKPTGEFPRCYLTVSVSYVTAQSSSQTRPLFSVSLVKAIRPTYRTDGMESPDALLPKHCSPGHAYIFVKAAQNGFHFTPKDYEHMQSKILKSINEKGTFEMGHLTPMIWNCGFTKIQSEIEIYSEIMLPKITFTIVPIRVLNVLPSPLFEHLVAQKTSEMKSGFVTMNHLRKIEILDASNPRVSELPIVGIWVSGVADMGHPFVWASCMRFVMSTVIQDKVMMEEGTDSSFLILYLDDFEKKADYIQSSRLVPVSSYECTYQKTEPDWERFRFMANLSINKNDTAQVSYVNIPDETDSLTSRNFRLATRLTENSQATPDPGNISHQHAGATEEGSFSINPRNPPQPHNISINQRGRASPNKSELHRTRLPVPDTTPHTSTIRSESYEAQSAIFDLMRMMQQQQMQIEFLRQQLQLMQTQLNQTQQQVLHLNSQQESLVSSNNALKSEIKDLKVTTSEKKAQLNTVGINTSIESKSPPKNHRSSLDQTNHITRILDFNRPIQEPPVFQQTPTFNLMSLKKSVQATHPIGQQLEEPSVLLDVSSIVHEKKESIEGYAEPYNPHSYDTECKQQPLPEQSSPILFRHIAKLSAEPLNSRSNGSFSKSSSEKPQVMVESANGQQHRYKSQSDESVLPDESLTTIRPDELSVLIPRQNEILFARLKSIGSNEPILAKEYLGTPSSSLALQPEVTKSRMEQPRTALSPARTMDFSYRKDSLLDLSDSDDDASIRPSNPPKNIRDMSVSDFSSIAFVSKMKVPVIPNFPRSVRAPITTAQPVISQGSKNARETRAPSMPLQANILDGLTAHTLGRKESKFGD